MKKFISVLLVFIMLFGLAAPAWAAPASTKVEFDSVDLVDLYPNYSVLSRDGDTLKFGPIPTSQFTPEQLQLYNTVKEICDSSYSNSNYGVIVAFIQDIYIQFVIFDKSSAYYSFTTVTDFRNQDLSFNYEKISSFTICIDGTAEPTYFFDILNQPRRSYFDFVHGSTVIPIAVSSGVSMSNFSMSNFYDPSTFLRRPQLDSSKIFLFDDSAALTHTLTVDYKYTDGTKAADSVTQSLETDAAYNIPSPSIPGYIPDQTAVTGTMPDSDQTITVTYTKNSHNLTVNYQYEDGEKAADSVSRTIGYNEPYSIPSPSIEGYKPSQAAVAGNMPDNDLSVDVVYSKNKYNLNVSYLYEDGSKAAEPVSKQVAYNSTYSIFSPSIPGYTPDKPTITGIMKAQDLSATVTYKQNKHDLTVSYFYENGLKAAESVTQTVGYNDAYNIISPEISGYLPDKPTVSGKMPDNDLSVRVVYSAQTESHSVTVNYVYADGTTAADSKVNRYPTGFMYHLESPTIEGYKADIPVVSGQMQNEDITVTVTYTKEEESGGNSGGDNPGGGGSGGETSGGGGDSGGGSIFPPVYPPYDGDFPFPDYTPEYNGDNPFDVTGKYPPYQGDFPFPDYTPEYNGDNPFDLAGKYPPYQGDFPFPDYTPEYNGDDPFDVAGKYPPSDPAEAAQFFIDYYKGLS